MTIRFASVCSGVGTDHLAWSPLGWESAWFSEIDPAAGAILAYQFANVPNIGDMVALCDRAEALGRESAAKGCGWMQQNHPDAFTDFDIDVLGGGTPCQAFSFAGLRKSLGDARGNLSLVFCRLVHAIDHLRHARGHAAGLPVVVWENVPGVFSAPGNAFGCILAGLVGAEQPVLPDGGWKRAGLVVGPRRAAAYRVLDAQYFGLAQRRERVVVVSCSRASGLDPCEILFESEGVRRDHPPRRRSREDVAGTIAASTGERGGTGQDAASGLLIASTLTGGGRAAGGYSEDDIPHVVHSLTAEGHDASEDGTGRGTPLVAHCLTAQPQMHHDASQDTLIAHCLSAKGGSGRIDAESETFIVCQQGEISHTLTTDCGSATESCEGSGNGAPLIPVARPIAFSCKDHGQDAGEIAPTMRAMGHADSHQNGGGQLAVALPIPLDMRQASRGEKMTNNRPGGSSGGAAGTGIGEAGDPAPTLSTSHEPAVCTPAASGSHWAVRRIMPTEGEGLQGYPRNHTLVPYRGKPMADGPRYKAIGNGWAMPVFAWVGKRIDAALRKAGLA